MGCTTGLEYVKIFVIGNINQCYNAAEAARTNNFINLKLKSERGKSMKKYTKVMGILLALVMLAALMPMTALAGGNVERGSRGAFAVCIERERAPELAARGGSRFVRAEKLHFLQRHGKDYALNGLVRIAFGGDKRGFGGEYGAIQP